MIALAVNTLEHMSTWFPFLCFKLWGICFEIYFAIPYYFPMVYQFVRTVALLIFYSVHVTHKYSMILFLAILVLGNTRVYFCFSNCGNITFYVETHINKAFCVCSIL